jgi:hypothetical protein
VGATHVHAHALAASAAHALAAGLPWPLVVLPLFGAPVCSSDKTVRCGSSSAYCFSISAKLSASNIKSS